MENKVVDEHKSNHQVFYISLACTALLVGCGLVNPDAFGKAAKSAFDFFIKYIGWWYMLVMTGYVAFSFFLAFSRFGKLKLGPADSQPEFSTVSWFGMLFGASMGVGLVFYGVGEPMYHLAAPPFGAEPGTAQAAEDAMRASFFHWGLHPWAAYAVIGVCLGYFQYRKGAPGLMSSLILPFLGPRGHLSLLGRVVDILTSIATVAGIATSIGLAALQINSGLKYVFDLPQGASMQLAIILVIGFIYTFATVSGLTKGIKFLGDMNLILAFTLAGLLLLLGPTLTLIETLVTGIGSYFQNFILESFDVSPYGGDYKGWLGGWTIFYWAWWIAWAPFVGSFIARISKGRTIREFIIGALFVPTFGSFCWFSIFGGTALKFQLDGAADIASAVNADLASGAFSLYQNIPLGGLMSVVMIVLISTFLITSANASTFALGMFSSEGNLNPPKPRMIVWGVLQAALAFVLLKTGGLSNLQTSSITAAAPFSIIMALACYCLWKALNDDFGDRTDIK